MKKIIVSFMLSVIFLLTLVSCGHNHSFGEWSVTKEATCTEQGLKERVCECGEKQTQKMGALGHNVVIDAAVAATCTSTGLTAGKHCSVCSVIIVPQTEVSTVPHSEVVDEAVAPTCTVAGLTEGKHCSVCSVIIVPQTEVSTVPHIEVVDEAVAPTCTVAGLTEGKHCSVCSVIIVPQTEVSTVPHSEVVDEAVAPTCTVAGLTAGKHCSQCDTILVQQETISKLGHTCQQGICERCEEYYDILDDIIILKPDGTKYTLGTTQFVGKSYRNYYTFYCNVYFDSAVNWITINPDNTVTLTFEIDYCNGTSYSNVTYIGCSFRLYDPEGKVIASCYKAHSCGTGNPTYTSGKKTVVLKPGEVYQMMVGSFG